MAGSRKSETSPLSGSPGSAKTFTSAVIRELMGDVLGVLASRLIVVGKHDDREVGEVVGEGFLGWELAVALALLAPPGFVVATSASFARRSGSSRPHRRTPVRPSYASQVRKPVGHPRDASHVRIPATIGTLVLLTEFLARVAHHTGPRDGLVLVDRDES